MTDTQRKWDTGAAAWRHFCDEDHPELGLLGNQRSWENFWRKYRALLEEEGIARRSPARGTAIVDMEVFEPFVFDLLTLPDAPGAPTTRVATKRARRTHQVAAVPDTVKRPPAPQPVEGWPSPPPRRRQRKPVASVATE